MGYMLNNVCDSNIVFIKLYELITNSNELSTHKT